MANRRNHYVAAEQILVEGVKAVAKISQLADERDNIKGSGQDYDDQYSSLTARMDEQGKKAMGCWAQAQVHATLAQCGVSVADG